MDAATIIDSILAKMTASLQKGEWVYLKDFGSFTRKMRPGHKVRHPKTGKLIWIPPRPDISFNPAKGLLKMIEEIKKTHIVHLAINANKSDFRSRLRHIAHDTTWA